MEIILKHVFENFNLSRRRRTYEDHPRHMELRKALSALFVCGFAQSEGPSVAENEFPKNSSGIQEVYRFAEYRAS